MEAEEPSIPETFRRIVRFLEGEHVPYVVIGGIAAALRGEPRGTNDVDLMITVPSSRVWRLAEAARAQGFCVDPEQAELHWLSSGFVRFWYGPEGRQVAADLMACNSDFLREAAWRAEQARVFGLQVPLAKAEDLILFKLASWRVKDIADVVAVSRRHEGRLDLGYLRKWAAWFALRNPCFADVPTRLEAVIEGRTLPPPTDV